MPERIVVLVGPTAAGKTGLALRLALALQAEIVGADSMQVYRGMDIGTAKPTPEERGLVPHHLIDVVRPDEAFHAGRYRRSADLAVEAIRGRGRLPLVVGGTGLYVRALLHGLFQDPSGPQGRPAGAVFARRPPGGEDLHAQLSRVDPAAARAVHPNDRVRIERALDVFERTGMRITELREGHGFLERRYDALVLGLCPERGALYRRIDLRVDAMLRAGLLEEVAGLLREGFSADLPAMRGLGYRHMTRVVEGRSSVDEARETLKRDTRRYAKRQLTWFRNQEPVTWFDAPDPFRPILETIQRFLARPVKQIV